MTGGLRPGCLVCAAVGEQATTEGDHPHGCETKWDWVELPCTPWLAAGRDSDARLLVGSLSFSSRSRGVFADSEEQSQLIDAVQRRDAWGAVADGTGMAGSDVRIRFARLQVAEPGGEFDGTRQRRGLSEFSGNDFYVTHDVGDTDTLQFVTRR